MVESNSAVVGIVGVVSVLSGSFLGSIPSMDMTCVWCQPNVKSRRLFTKGPIGFARNASETRSRTCLVWVPDIPTQRSKTLTIFARCHDTVLLKLEPAQRMVVYLFRLQFHHQYGRQG